MGRVRENSRGYLVCASRRMNPFLRNDFVGRTDPRCLPDRAFACRSSSTSVTLQVHAVFPALTAAARARASDMCIKCHSLCV